MILNATKMGSQIEIETVTSRQLSGERGFYNVNIFDSDNELAVHVLYLSITILMKKLTQLLHVDLTLYVSWLSVIKSQAHCKQ